MGSIPVRATALTKNFINIMNRKILTKEDLLLLNGNLIYIFRPSFESDESAELNKKPALVHIENESVYLLNNSYSGATPGEFNFELSPFKRSWCYDDEVICMEMTDSDKNVYIEKIKTYNALNDGDKIYYNGKIGDVKIMAVHGKTFEAESIIDIEHDFFILEKEIVKSFKNITEDPLLDKKDIEKFVNGFKDYSTVTRHFPKYFYKKIPLSISLTNSPVVDIDYFRV